jgi:hypothetical protein
VQGTGVHQWGEHVGAFLISVAQGLAGFTEGFGSHGRSEGLRVEGVALHDFDGGEGGVEQVAEEVGGGDVWDGRWERFCLGFDRHTHKVEGGGGVCKGEVCMTAKRRTKAFIGGRQLKLSHEAIRG